MPTLRLNILDGINSIGGSKIALTGEGGGILLDFGVNMKKKREYILGHRALTIANKLYYYLYSEILPRVRGLYREDLVEIDERVSRLLTHAREIDVQTCVISHAHADHYGAAGFLSNEIALAVSNSMKTIMEAMLESSSLDIEGEVFSMRDRGDKGIGRFDRRACVFEEGTGIPEAPFKITPYPVDHSIPASFGFLVEEASLTYTGDLRKHGLLSELTEKFTEKVRGVNYLLIEGTRIDSSIRVPEHEVSREIRHYVLEKADKLVCVVTSPTDIDRIRDLVEAARELGKKPVICPRIINLLDRLSDSRTKITIPNLGDVGVYFERRSLTGDGYDLESANYRGWLKKVYLDRVDGKRGGELVKPDEIAKQQEKYLFIMSGLDYVLELAQIRPKPGSRIIVSTSEPHDEEQEIEWSKFERWVHLLRLDLRNVHSSGHADRESLIEIINEINPRKILPIHTENPYEFQRLLKLGEIKCQVILPKPDEPITL
ncbi:MAG: hypothetical protein N3F65_00095 [Nitrososphaeria archaeon]|nr:hypothetical protein [Aigarchaeota archaeon]MCX8187001.1 hypothetical protein [Nitrososphaeria archaeon]MDW8021463.1 MBL fold metallo-hydrolase RNA specificity domain-containing protein [Nitrososphaerota archaeon]